MKTNLGYKSNMHGLRLPWQTGACQRFSPSCLPQRGHTHRTSPDARRFAGAAEENRIDEIQRTGGVLHDSPCPHWRECWDRLTEVVGTFFEKQGLKNIELGKTEFKPEAQSDMERLAVSLGDFVKKNPSPRSMRCTPSTMARADSWTSFAW